ncbi:MAG: hypothetical protein WCT31_03610 [Candidatus Micrarchaeia archaeon]|jgi:hypothetical protein
MGGRKAVGQGGQVFVAELGNVEADRCTQVCRSDSLTIRKYTWEDVRDALNDAMPKMAERFGNTERFEYFCKTLFKIMETHRGIKPEHFAAWLKANESAVNNYCKERKASKDFKAVAMEDLHEITYSAVVIGNLVHINPARFLAIAEKESMLRPNKHHLNSNGSTDSGVCQINDRNNTLASYNKDDDYWFRKLNERMGNRGGKYMMFKFPTDIWGTNTDILLNFWAAGIMMLEKKPRGTDANIQKWLSAYNGKETEYGQEVYANSEKIRKAYGFCYGKVEQ